MNVLTEFAFKFVYKIKLENDLIEHEYDHVFIGRFEGDPVINRNEVEAWRVVTFDQLRLEMSEHPEQFTHWFKLIMNHPEINAITV